MRFVEPSRRVHQEGGPFVCDKRHVEVLRQIGAKSADTFGQAEGRFVERHLPGVANRHVDDRVRKFSEYPRGDGQRLPNLPAQSS